MEMCYDGALVMPSSYVVMDEEEMTYTEGGKSELAYINKTAIKQMVAGLLFVEIHSLVAIGSAGLTVKLISSTSALCGKIGSFLGPVGSAVGFILGAVSASSIARAFVDAILKNKGVSFGWDFWRPYVEAK